MPPYKSVSSLYNICIKNVYNCVYSYCTNLDKNHVKDRSMKIRNLNLLFVEMLPTSILDSILAYHTNKKQCNDCIKSFYFYNVILHKNVKKFHAQNHRLSISDWTCLFKSSFSQLKELNLALSCSDSILQLIPKYCPMLETLNATCKYERLNVGGNAVSLTLSVTNVGLDYLCKCEKLKYLTVNAPRSQERGVYNGITYSGLRKLLREVKTLEDITYSDMGSVVCKEMNDIESLNMRVIRHMNGTKSSLREIFRLCNQLEELYLFNFEPQKDIIEEMLMANLRLKSLEVQCLHFELKFSDFFEKIGPNLISLSIRNLNEPITFSNLITIGQHCPKLKYLNCERVVNSRDYYIKSPDSIEQFSQLQTLSILGHDMDFERILLFCTKNARNLENIKIIERSSPARLDHIFIDSINSSNLKHIEASSMLYFSKKGIQKIIEKFKNLTYLNVFCPDDCSDVVQTIMKSNYEFTFINKKTILFL